MAMSLEERVFNLEEMMAQLIQTVAQTSRELQMFKEEMREFKEEMRASNRQMNRRWGELANKMGTMAEDLVAPGIPRILRTVVDCPEDAIESMAVRVRRRDTETGIMREFDVVAACGEYVLVNETKSTLRPEDIRNFADRLPGVRRFFPEYKDRKFIGAIGSLYVDESLVRRGEKLGLIVLGFGEEVVSVLNSPGFTPRAF